MKYAIKVKQSGEIESIYPDVIWMKTKPSECDGRCYKGLYK